ncbi:multidrug transporter subunit MdtD [Desulfovibrio sp. OttesenSCG-928-F07]|nr:multidrug transporter subunit MdtD [Desulfovibrio sp. OttesenSCG-928-F07]
MSENLPENAKLNPAATGINEQGVIAVNPQTKRLVLWLVATAFFMQMLDSTILNTALPVIATELGASPLRMQMVIISYVLTVALLIPSTGWLADRFGVRRVFFGAIFIFSLGSLLCAVSNSLHGLIAARVVQGVGGAVMAPVGRLAILRIVPRNELIGAMSFISIPGLIGPLLGPTVGGLLVQYASWHWIFIINIPVGILGCILTLRYMPQLTVSKVFRFDWAGFVLLGLAIVSFTIGIEGLSELHFAPLIYRSLFAGAALSFAIYIFYAKRAAHPLFDLSIFKNRAFSVGIAGNLVSRLGSSAMPFLTPLFLQLGMGFSPAKAGLTMIPMSAGAILSKIFVSRVVKKLGYRRLLVCNTLILGSLLMSFSLIPLYSNYPLLLLHLTIFGIINSTQFSIMNTTTLMDLSVYQGSTGNSILSMVMQISISMGVSIGAALLAFYLANTGAATTGLENAPKAFRYTFLSIGWFSVCSSIIFSFMPKGLDKKDQSPSQPH